MEVILILVFFCDVSNDRMKSTSSFINEWGSGVEVSPQFAQRVNLQRQNRKKRQNPRLPTNLSITASFVTIAVTAAIRSSQLPSHAKISVQKKN